MQLELGFWPRGCVRQVLMDYLAMRAESITGETHDDDYACRVRWLCEVLGELTPAESVDYNEIERVARAARGCLADVTIRRRLVFWASAVRYAVKRKVIAAEPERPPEWLRGGQKFDDYHTLAQYQAFRLALPPGRYRRYEDMGFWTGMHTLDIARTERWMLEPDHVWEGSAQMGRWWRRCNKNASTSGRRRPVEPCWVPMEPELRELALEWLSERADPSALVVGHLNNLRRTYDLAAHRADVPRKRANLGNRASHATLLLARGYSYEYVRLVLGHRGEVSAEARADGPARAATAKRPSVLTGHYARSSPDILRPQR